MDASCERCTEKDLRCEYMAVAEQQGSPIANPSSESTLSFPMPDRRSPSSKNHGEYKNLHPHGSVTPSSIPFNPNAAQRRTQPFTRTVHRTMGRSSHARYPIVNQRPAYGYEGTFFNIQPAAVHAPRAPTLDLTTQRQNPIAPINCQYFPDPSFKNVPYDADGYTGQVAHCTT